MTTAAMMLGGLALVLSTVWGPLGGPPAWCAAGLLKLTRAIVLWGVEQRWGHRFVVGPAWGWVLVFYVLLGLAVVALTQRVDWAGFPLRRSHGPYRGGYWRRGWSRAGCSQEFWLRGLRRRRPSSLLSGMAWRCCSHTGRPSLSVRLRAAGRPERRAADRRTGALGAGSEPDRRGLSEPCRSGSLRRPDRSARPVSDRRGAHHPSFWRRRQSSGRRPAHANQSRGIPIKLVTAPSLGKQRASRSRYGIPRTVLMPRPATTLAASCSMSPTPAVTSC